MAKFDYRVEFELDGGHWNTTIRDSKDFCLGFLHATRYQYPRNAMRVVRSDGKIIAEVPAYEDVSIGMVAGYPTAEQYERAAGRALEKAEKIRECEKLRNQRKFNLTSE
jgi:hypothetical protein